MFRTVKDAAAVPLNLTELAPVKPEPVILTFVPTVPAVGEKPEIAGRPMKVNFAWLATDPPGVVTVIGPVDAPFFTTAVIWVELATVNEAAGHPLNVTLVAPVRSVPV